MKNEFNEIGQGTSIFDVILVFLGLVLAILAFYIGFELIDTSLLGLDPGLMQSAYFGGVLISLVPKLREKLAQPMAFGAFFVATAVGVYFIHSVPDRWIALPIQLYQSLSRKAKRLVHEIVGSTFFAGASMNFLVSIIALNTADFAQLSSVDGTAVNLLTETQEIETHWYLWRDLEGEDHVAFRAIATEFIARELLDNVSFGATEYFSPPRAEISYNLSLASRIAIVLFNASIALYVVQTLLVAFRKRGDLKFST